MRIPAESALPNTCCVSNPHQAIRETNPYETKSNPDLLKTKNVNHLLDIPISNIPNTFVHYPNANS